DADGHMARRPVLEKMAEELRLPILTVKELQEYRRSVVSQPVPPVHLPSAYGDFTLRHFDDGNLALIKGDPTTTTPLVRVHSECFTGDVLSSLRCDCGPQLHAAMEAIDQAGTGILIYLRQEGRGIGLPNKLRAYRLQEEGFDTVEANHQLGFAADERTYEAASHILRALHVSTIKLLTNNPDKISQLEEAGITVAARVPLEMPATAYDRAYLKTKQEKMHHLLKLTEEEQHA
ncbi:MAG: GTP cyclohydrolase II, partial [Limosilactobacillus fermentum]